MASGRGRPTGRAVGKARKDKNKNWSIVWESDVEVLRDLLVSRPKSRKGLPPWDNWSGQLRSNIYALVRRYRKAGQLHTIANAVAAHRRKPLKIALSENPFYWALYAARNDGDIDMLSDKDISRFAKQMLYADRHNIDPELLAGFVYQQGNETDLNRKLAAGETEPWLDEYIARGRDALW